MEGTVGGSPEDALTPAQNIEQIETVIDKGKFVKNFGQTSSIPEEGYVSWLEVLGAFCLNLNTWQANLFSRPHLPAAQILMQQSQGADECIWSLPEKISWVGSTQAFLVFLTSVAAGPTFDAGHHKLLLRGGSNLTVMGMFMTSICKEYYQVFPAQVIMMGIGFGLLYLPAPAIVSQFFQSHRTLAVGISSPGSALGMYLISMRRAHHQVT
ncbi:hypothetical protein NHQ30_003924 [Ciborinia camelliae]|nr:hypothetical protein NHQ30_003924 [Ciborinia camelliae]